jgi:DNA-binding NtrC family response regulator
MNGTDTMLIGESAPMQRLRMLIAAVAPTRIPVLIEGATGTGKELVAALLHKESRRGGALIAFNVCALSDSMFEDALFGHVKGAFTGAAGETLGFLREANGGTAFFDEISGLSLSLQAKLLRALETGVVRPIGSSRDARSDFRALAATNERLDDLVEKGHFRADLAHRLRGMVLRVPTLAERIDDIPILVEHFIRGVRANQQVQVTRSAMQMLQQHAWPGNVRELKQVVETSLAFSREVLEVEALEIVLAQRGDNPRIDAPELVERQRLLKLLMSSEWDTEVAASMIGVHRTTIYRRMRRHGIPVPSSSGNGLIEVPITSLVPPSGRFAPGCGDLRQREATRANATA